MYREPWEMLDDLEDPPYECPFCDEKDELIEDARGYIAKISEALYSEDELDMGTLEDDMENLCHLLRVPFKYPNLPNIIRPKKQAEMFEMAKNILTDRYC